MKYARLLLTGFLLFLATGCAAGGATDSALGEYGLQNADSRQVIDRLDQTNKDRGSGLNASVTYDAVVLEEDGRETTLPMPDDEFYLSVAPFVGTTHDCFNHSLTGCQGELSNVPMEVRITDSDGTVLVDEAVRTYDNGFVGFWLPKGIEGTLEFKAPQGTATASFSTFTDSPTCITTLQLV